MNKKGNAGAWVAAFGLLFASGLLFLTMTPVMNSLLDMNTTGFTPQQLETRAMFQTVWHMWPPILILAAVLFIFVWTLRGDTYGGFR